MTRPFETEREAMDSVRWIYDMMPGPGSQPWSDANEGLIVQALVTTGVPLGAYDQRIVRWLARWEPCVVATVVRWILAAREAGNSGNP
jgi:hypothetical protein